MSGYEGLMTSALLRAAQFLLAEPRHGIFHLKILWYITRILSFDNALVTPLGLCVVGLAVTQADGLN